MKRAARRRNPSVSAVGIPQCFRPMSLVASRSDVPADGGQDGQLEKDLAVGKGLASAWPAARQAKLKADRIVGRFFQARCRSPWHQTCVTAALSQITERRRVSGVSRGADLRRRKEAGRFEVLAAEGLPAGQLIRRVVRRLLADL
jgi:hypothetical protein